jgi:hypothetical protein
MNSHAFSMDPTWNLPKPCIVSFCEVCVASICACTPFFWPTISHQLSKIFVTYEVNVSTESRFQVVEDEVELANSESWPARTESATSSKEVRDAEVGRVEKGEMEDYTRDFKGEAVVQAGAPAKKKSRRGFVRFTESPR